MTTREQYNSEIRKCLGSESEYRKVLESYRFIRGIDPTNRLIMNFKDGTDIMDLKPEIEWIKLGRRVREDATGYELLYLSGIEKLVDNDGNAIELKNLSTYEISKAVEYGVIQRKLIKQEEKKITLFDVQETILIDREAFENYIESRKITIRTQNIIRNAKNILGLDISELANDESMGDNKESLTIGLNKIVYTIIEQVVSLIYTKEDEEDKEKYEEIKSVLINSADVAVSSLLGIQGIALYTKIESINKYLFDEKSENLALENYIYAMDDIITTVMSVLDVFGEGSHSKPSYEEKAVVYEKAEELLKMLRACMIRYNMKKRRLGYNVD